MDVKLINKIDEGVDIKSFIFQPEKPVKYLPGQYFYYTLPKLVKNDPRGATRHFTASSSPTEKHLQLTTKVSDSGYKQALSSLEIGTLVELDGPSGTFILDENEIGDHVFLAGGIGITPFRSIIKYHLDKNLTNNLHLIYSCKTLDECVFYSELTGGKNSIKVDITLTEPKESWSGRKGRIDASLIQNVLGNTLKTYTAWACGPPGFVNAMEVLAEKLNFKDVRSEKFTGY